MLSEVKKEVDIMASNALQVPRDVQLIFSTQRILRGHPNIVNLIDSTWSRLSDGRYEGYILMEYCSGQAISLRYHPESTYGCFMGSSTYCETIQVAEACISLGLLGNPLEYLVPDCRSMQVYFYIVSHARRVPLRSPLLTAHTPPWVPLSTGVDTAQWPDSAESHSCNEISDTLRFFRWWHHRHDEPTPARTSH